MSKRSNGESSIHRDAAGVWHAYVTVGTRPDGSLDRRHRRGKTRATVMRKVRVLESQRDKGAVTAPGQTWNVTLWVEHYIDNVRGTALAAQTSRSYRGHLDEWITPNIGSIALTALRVEHVEAMFAAMRRQGRKAATCERVRATLRAALTVAVRRNLVARNVASLAQVPHRDDKYDHALPLTSAEARRVVAVSSTRPDGARWALAMLGLRPAEVLGLDWRSVDLAQAWLSVDQQLVAVYPYRHGCPDDDECRANKALRCSRRIGGRMLSRTKSTKGRRRLSLPPQLVALLREHRNAWLAARLRAGSAWTFCWGELVFCQPNGHPLDASKDRATWHALLADAGVDGRRLYDARHSAATLLLEEGGDLQQVKDLLGHSQISVTSRYYAHATDRLAQDSAMRLGSALFGDATG